MHICYNLRNSFCILEQLNTFICSPSIDDTSWNAFKIQTSLMNKWLMFRCKRLITINGRLLNDGRDWGSCWARYSIWGTFSFLAFRLHFNINEIPRRSAPTVTSPPQASVSPSIVWKRTSLSVLYFWDSFWYPFIRQTDHTSNMYQV